MSEGTNTQSSIKSLVLAVIALLAAAVNTNRLDDEAIAQQKADAEKHAADLQAKIDELQAKSDSEEGDIRQALTDALTQAQAAKPPTEEQVASVNDIPAAAPGDQQTEAAA